MGPSFEAIVILILCAAATFGGAAGIMYYSLKLGKEHDLRELQYRNELINSLEKESSRRAKQRRRSPKHKFSSPYIRNFPQRLRKSSPLKGKHSLRAGL